MTSPEVEPGVLSVGLSQSPLAKEHERLLKSLLRRGDNSPERTPEDVLQGTYAPQAISMARQSWLQRMAHEHHSSVSFSGTLPHLMAAQAPLDIKTIVLRCAMDELRHAGLCGQVVEFLGGRARIPSDLHVLNPPEHRDCSRRVAALRNVLFASLSETISVGLLTVERELVQEPFLKRVLKQLAGDEVLHARLGWFYLAITWPQLDTQERQDLRAYIPVALKHLYNEMRGAMHVGTTLDAQMLAQTQALGMSYGPQGREILEQTMQEVIVPQLDQFELGAADAWGAIKRSEAPQTAPCSVTS